MKTSMRLSRKLLFQLICLYLCVYIIPSLADNAHGGNSSRQRIAGPNVCGSRGRNCCSGWKRLTSRSMCTTPKCDDNCGDGGICVAPRKCRCADGSFNKKCVPSLPLTQAQQQRKIRAFPGQCNKSRYMCQHVCMDVAKNMFQCVCPKGHRLSPNYRSCLRDRNDTRSRRPGSSQGMSQTSTRHVSNHRWKRSELPDDHTKIPATKTDKLYGNPPLFHDDTQSVSKSFRSIYNALVSPRLPNSRIRNHKNRGQVLETKKEDVSTTQTKKPIYPPILMKAFSMYKKQMLDTIKSQEKTTKLIPQAVTRSLVRNDRKSRTDIHSKNSSSKEEEANENKESNAKSRRFMELDLEYKYLTGSINFLKHVNSNAFKAKGKESYQEPQNSKQKLDSINGLDKNNQETAEFFQKESSDDLNKNGDLDKEDIDDMKELMTNLKLDKLRQTLKPVVKESAPFVGYTDIPLKNIHDKSKLEELKQLPDFKKFTETMDWKYGDIEKHKYYDYNYKHSYEVERPSSLKHKLFSDFEKEQLSHLNYKPNSDLPEVESESLEKETEKKKIESIFGQDTKSVEKDLPKKKMFDKYEKYHIFSEKQRDKTGHGEIHSKEKDGKFKQYSSNNFMSKYADKSEDEDKSFLQQKPDEFQNIVYHKKSPFGNLISKTKYEYPITDENLPVKEHNMKSVKSFQKSTAEDQKKLMHKLTKADDRTRSSTGKTEVMNVRKQIIDKHISTSSEKYDQIMKTDLQKVLKKAIQEKQTDRNLETVSKEFVKTDKPGNFKKEKILPKTQTPIYVLQNPLFKNNENQEKKLLSAMTSAPYSKEFAPFDKKQRNVKRAKIDSKIIQDGKHDDTRNLNHSLNQQKWDLVNIRTMKNIVSMI